MTKQHQAADLRGAAEASVKAGLATDGAPMADTDLRRQVRDLQAGQAELERQNAELRQAAAERAGKQPDKALSRRLAAAGHDLRQPLSALSIYVDVLKAHVAPGGRPVLAKLGDCVGSLSARLTDLLDLSKLDAGMVTPSPGDFSVHDTLASLVSGHAHAAQAKGLSLRCVSSHLTAHTDPLLFRRILANFIDNAIRYSERGGVLLGCRRRQGKTWVEVWDTGIGMADDKTVEIFDELNLVVDDARTPNGGLGLAIAARSAALLGLEISVRSRPGRGSVFAVELPLAQPQAIPPPESCDIEYRSLRIALVEDNAMVREAFAQALQGAGHQVLAAGSGEELRNELGGLPPDVVVADLRLNRGEMGLDVITTLRASMGADLPAILVTGETDPSLTRSMAERGIVVLHKPVDLETLLAYLEDLTYQDPAMSP